MKPDTEQSCIYSDWKHVAFKLADVDAITGCDFVGQVVEIGSEVPQDVKGSIRLGFVRGGKNTTNGAFAEYVKQEYDITAEVPKNVTPAQAASAPIPCTCKGVNLHQCILHTDNHLLLSRLHGMSGSVPATRHSSTRPGYQQCRRQVDLDLVWLDCSWPVRLEHRMEILHLF